MKTKAQLLLRWPRNVAQVEFSLSGDGHLSLSRSFWVTSENIESTKVMYFWNVDSVGYIFLADSMGLTTTTMA